MVSTQILEIGLQAVDNNSPARIIASDSGGGGGGGAGVESFFDVFTELDVNDYPADSFFDLFFETEKPEIDKASPMLAKPPLAIPADSFFDVYCELSVDGGQESLHIHGAIGPGQPLVFTNVNIPTVGDSFFDIFVQIDKSSPLLLGVPLFTMTVTGTFIPEPGSLLLLLLGGAFASLKRRR
jgi:hypothetical protein